MKILFVVSRLEDWQFAFKLGEGFYQTDEAGFAAAVEEVARGVGFFRDVERVLRLRRGHDPIGLAVVTVEVDGRVFRSGVGVARHSIE